MGRSCKTDTGGSDALDLHYQKIARELLGEETLGQTNIGVLNVVMIGKDELLEHATDIKTHPIYFAGMRVQPGTAEAHFTPVTFKLNGIPVMYAVGVAKPPNDYTPVLLYP